MADTLEPRPQDVVGAVSTRAVPLDASVLSDECDSAAGSVRRVLALVDWEAAATAAAAAATTAASARAGKSKGKGKKPRGRPKRWCAKEFDPASGVYTCSTDGVYLVALSVEERGGRGGAAADRLPSDSFFATLHQGHACGSTSDNYDHVDATTGRAGKLVHLRAGDTLSVRLLIAADASEADLRGVDRVAATLAIELCQRKRKRAIDSDSDDDDHSTTKGQDAHQVKRRVIAKGKRRVAAKNPDPQHARQQDAVAPGAVADAEAAADADTTGSDTEWSEGFSSDDEAMEERRSARPPKEARRLARGVTAMTVAP